MKEVTKGDAIIIGILIAMLGIEAYQLMLVYKGSKL